MSNKKNSQKKNSKKRLQKLDSTQHWSPIKEIKDGIVITKNGNFVQILELAPINYSLLPEKQQVSIAHVFGSIVRAFPQRFHIKVLSRKANVETHIRNLRGHMETEQNSLCRRMQENTIRQIKNDAISGVSRRFFLSFPYEQRLTLRRPSWPEIRSSLRTDAGQIAAMLDAEPCNNVLLAPIGSTKHIQDILYNCMCRSEAELKSLDTKISDIVCSHIVEQGYVDDGKKTIPSNDFLSPKKIDRSHYTYTEVDGKYYAFGYIHQDSIKMQQRAGWLSALVNLEEGVDVDIWVEQKDPASEQTKISMSNQLTENSLYHTRRNAADRNTKKNKFASEDYLQLGLENEQKLFMFSIMVSVVADSLSALKEKYERVNNRCKLNNLKLRPLHGNHDLAFRGSLPICEPEPYVIQYAERNILSCDFGSIYPFTSYELNDPNGIPIGRNMKNQTQLFLDFYNRFIYNNGNAVFFGSSGSGKTYALQCLALRLRQYQTQTIIIAPYKGEEYLPACKAIGGTFIRLGPGPGYATINIMEIRKYSVSKEAALLSDVSSVDLSPLSSKILQIQGFFRIRLPDMTLEEEHILQEALLDTYKKFHITKAPKSLEDPTRPGKYRPMPTLGDLDNQLATYKKGASRLRTALSAFVGNGICSNFNGQTNVNLDNPYVVIDVSRMPNELMPIGIYLAADYSYDTIRADKTKRKAILMDELSRMIGLDGSADAAEFVLKQYKTVRAYNTIIVSATQDTNDFFALKDGIYGRGILANAKIKFILKQEDTEAETLGKLLNLTETEKERLTYYQRGEGLLIANRNHVEFTVTASASEHEIITSNPDELLAIYSKRKNRR